MKRDFALRIDTLLSGVRASLESVIYYTKNHLSRGDLTERRVEKTNIVDRQKYGRNVQTVERTVRRISRYHARRIEKRPETRLKDR
jgi:hypothetical protein